MDFGFENMAGSAEFSLEIWGEENGILSAVVQRLRENKFISKERLTFLIEKFPKTDRESSSKLAQFFGIDELQAILLQEALLAVSIVPNTSPASAPELSVPFSPPDPVNTNRVSTVEVEALQRMLQKSALDSFDPEKVAAQLAMWPMDPDNNIWEPIISYNEYELLRNAHLYPNSPPRKQVGTKKGHTCD